VYENRKTNVFHEIVFWVIGVIFFLFALIYIFHPILFLIFGFIGLISIPPGQFLLERKLRFILTNKIKIITISIMFVFSIPLIIHYSSVDLKNEEKQKQIDKKNQIDKIISQKKEIQRKDSLIYYIKKSNHLASENKIEQANEQ